MLTHIDLFSGIGGFSLAAERVGFRTICFCEINPYCRAVLKKHWPNIPIITDVRIFGESDRKWMGTNIITGGFPCQDLSRARFSSGRNLSGQNSSLFFQLARVVNGIYPHYVLIENVPRILNFMKIISRAMPEYEFYGEKLNAEDFGAFCRRKRAFIVGNLGKGSGREIFNIAKKHCQALFNRGSQDILPMCLPWKGGLSLERLASCLVENTEDDATRIRKGNGFSRRMDGHRYSMLGNAIVPQVAEEILRIIAAIEMRKSC